ncbi:hypothetical protein J8273_0859 [Carpediemonas membranifera]|uniref:Uncharacterized protein n=1 Tax=Carpediemonas membranifera TaxID=201153 RepID=A0A8J6E2A7_9EUKA|nr:hypothetical protein J8273_0859 [Carpediemonas membranifera]|eukprot:KAG9397374.1 hypothetical protein J8273_0859 [Carpediemonas membranifera]
MAQLREGDYMARLDLVKGYYQLGVRASDSPLLGFVVDGRPYAFNVQVHRSAAIAWAATGSLWEWTESTGSSACLTGKASGAKTSAREVEDDSIRSQRRDRASHKGGSVVQERTETDGRRRPRDRRAQSHRSTASRRIYCRRQRPRDSRSASARDHHDLEASCFIHYARRGGVPRGDLPQLQVQSNQWLRRTRSHLPPSPSPMGEGPLRLPSRLCCLHRGHGRPCRAPRDERDGDRDSRPPHPVQDPPPDREEHQARHRT